MKNKREQIQWLIDNINDIEISGIGESEFGDNPTLCIQINKSWDDINESPIPQGLGIVRID